LAGAVSGLFCSGAVVSLGGDTGKVSTFFSSGDAEAFSSGF